MTFTQLTRKLKGRSFISEIFSKPNPEFNFELRLHDGKPVRSALYLASLTYKPTVAQPRSLAEATTSSRCHPQSVNQHLLFVSESVA